MLIFHWCGAQPDLHNIISPNYIRTLRGKLTPPTSHRFTLSVLDSHRDPPHIALQLKAVPGWLGPLQRGPEVMRNDVIMFHPVVQRFRFKDRHHVARTRQVSVGRWIGITQLPEVFARFYHLERSRINRQINPRCYLLLTDSNLHLSNECLTFAVYNHPSASR